MRIFRTSGGQRLTLSLNHSEERSGLGGNGRPRNYARNT
jgi:hypothetical protein